MKTYLLLVKWTSDGAQNAGDTFERVSQAAALAEQHGCRFYDYRWLQGRYDFMVMLDAPDDEVAARFVVAASRSGAIRTETLRAFNEEEMKRIVD